MTKRFENFTVLITKINRLIHKIKAEEMEEFNLKSPHVSCLYYLYKAEKLTAYELCSICAEDKASISRSIDYLEQNGYMVCDSTAKKRYNAVFSLTEKGLKIGGAIADKIDSILDRLQDALQSSEREIMYNSLYAVLDGLEKFCEKYDK